VNIHALSSGSEAGHSQRLLAALLQQASSAGQGQSTEETSGDSCRAGGSPPGPPPGPPPGGGAKSLSSNTLRSLLESQDETKKTDKLGDFAARIIEATDTDGDGALSVEEITGALGQKAPEGLADAVASLDSDEDGLLGKTELTDALAARRQAHGPPPPPSSDEIAAKLIGGVDSDSDELISLDEVKSALGDEVEDADSLTSAFGKLDTDGDGNLSAAEIAAALDAFRSAFDRGRGHASSTTESVAA
jgi:Ca2+-binding EF-hand superfamily protein